MADIQNTVKLKVEADTQEVERSISELGRLSDAFGRQFTNAMRDAVVGGKALDDVLRRVGLNIAGMALNQGLKPLASQASSLFAELFSGLGKVFPHARGGVVPFASGGVVSAPTYFPMAGGVGLMGEAGAEAILPLGRTSDGRLGVAAGGGGGSVNVVFNVTSPDAGSFRKSEAQITGMLARAVSRGSRTL